jgi:hypothetical protein
MAKASKAVVESLVVLADQVLGDYANVFLARAEDDYDWFFDKLQTVDGNNETFEVKYMEERQFGKLWVGQDYAFRVLMNPDNRARITANLVAADEYRKANPNDGAKPFNLKPAHFQLLNDVLDQLAREQSPQVIIDVDYDDCGFWEDFIGEFAYYLDSGEVSDRG